MKRKKESSSLSFSPTLPHDLIMEVLLKLPVKSLLRFKIVCKSWLSIISNSQFAESHHNLSPNRLLLRPNGVSIESINVEESLSVSLNLPLPPLINNNSLVIMGSCRGVLVLNHSISGNLILWNPSTRVHKLITNAFHGSVYSTLLYGLGYHASTQDYLLILAYLNFRRIGFDYSLTLIQIFSSKTNSWKHMECLNAQYRHLGHKTRPGALLNGALHWLVLGSCNDDPVPLIAAFNLSERTFSDILLPHYLIEESKCEFNSLRVLGGCLGMCCLNQDNVTSEIWVMKEYKVHPSWTRCYVLSVFDFSHNQFAPICITKDGGILILNIDGSLVKLNEEGQLLEHVTSGQVHSSNLQAVMYKESLLPIPFPTNQGEEE